MSDKEWFSIVYALMKYPTKHAKVNDSKYHDPQYVRSIQVSLGTDLDQFSYVICDYKQAVAALNAILRIEQQERKFRALFEES